MGRHGFNEYGVDEASDKPVRKKPVQKGVAGVMAFMTLLGTGFLFYLALDSGSQAAACILQGGNFKTGIVLFLCGILTLILSVAFGGASVAKGEQSILGALTIGLVMLPAILMLASLLFDFSLDFSAFLPQGSTPKTVGMQPVHTCS